MKKILLGLALLLVLATVGLVVWGFVKPTAATALEETLEYMFFGEDSEDVEAAYGFEVPAEDVYSAINPEATETQIELYEACQDAVEDIVKIDTKLVSEDESSAVVELTVVPLDIVKVLEDVTVDAITPEFHDLSGEEKTEVITEQYFVALENAEAGVEQSFEVAMEKEGDFWVIQDVDSIQELNFVCTKFLTNIGTLPSKLAGEDDSAE